VETPTQTTTAVQTTVTALSEIGKFPDASVSNDAIDLLRSV
jgi:hypothetical protein